MNNKKAGYILGALELLALMQANTLWMAPFTHSAADSFSFILQILTGILSVILFILPVAGILLIYRDKRWGFLLLACFPLSCILFGITSLPVVSYFYGSHIKLNSLFTAFTNALVCAAAFWMFVSAHTNFNKAGLNEALNEQDDR